MLNFQQQRQPQCHACQQRCPAAPCRLSHPRNTKSGSPPPLPFLQLPLLAPARAELAARYASPAGQCRTAVAFAQLCTAAGTVALHVHALGRREEEAPGGGGGGGGSARSRPRVASLWAAARAAALCVSAGVDTRVRDLVLLLTGGHALPQQAPPWVLRAAAGLLLLSCLWCAALLLEHPSLSLPPQACVVQGSC